MSPLSLQKTVCGSPEHQIAEFSAGAGLILRVYGSPFHHFLLTQVTGDQAGANIPAPNAGGTHRSAGRWRGERWLCPRLTRVCMVVMHCHGEFCLPGEVKAKDSPASRLWHVPPSCARGTSQVFTPRPGAVGLALSWWTGVMSLEVLESVSLKPRGLITARAEALSICPPGAGFVQATHVSSCPSAKVFGEQGGWPRAGAAPGAHVAKGCGPVGAAPDEFTSLTIVFLNARGRKNSCAESGVAVFSTAACLLRVGPGERPGWLCYP